MSTSPTTPSIDILFQMWKETVQADDHKAAMKVGRSIVDLRQRHNIYPNWDSVEEEIFMNWARGVHLL